MAFKGKKRCHLSRALIARCQLSLLAFGLRNDYLQILACSQHLLFFVFFFLSYFRSVLGFQLVDLVISTKLKV